MLDRAAQFLQHAGFRKHGGNLAWLFAEKLLRLFVGVGVGIVVARSLGPAQYGLLNYAIGFVGLFAVMASLGFDPVLVRSLLRFPERRDVLLGTGFVLKSVGVAAMALVLGLMIGFGWCGRDAGPLVLLIGAGYTLSGFQVLELLFLAEERNRNTAISQMAALLAVSVLRIYGVWRECPVLFFAAAEAGYMLLCSLGYCWFAGVGAVRRWRWGRGEAAKLLHEGWPLALASIAVLLQMQFDILMLKWLSGDEAVGIYAAATRLVALWYFVPVIVGNVFFPAIIRARERSFTVYFRRLRAFFGLMIWCGAGLSVFCFLLSLLIPLMYGADYAASAQVMRISAWTLIPVFIGSARGRQLNAENRNRELMICAIGGALFCIGLNWLLIPGFGAAGSAFSALASFTVSFLILPLFWRKRGIGLRLLGGIFTFRRDVAELWKTK